MLNSRPSVSGHKQKVAPITRLDSNVCNVCDSNLGHGNNKAATICFTDMAVNGLSTWSWTWCFLQLALATVNGNCLLAMSVIFISIELSTENGDTR